MDHDTDPPRRVITADQAVAFNLARWRKAAGLTQQELGDRVGWTARAVSEAERSWDGRRTRLFHAQELTALATAAGVPLLAMFLPPEGDGTAYAIRGPGGDAGMDALMALVMPDTGDDSPVMGAYRDAWNRAAMRWLASDPQWAGLVARWLGDSGPNRAGRAARLRRGHDELLRAAADLAELASAIEEQA